MTENSKKVVTRFAPSPTGHLHIGGVRTALFSYLYARKHGGKFIMRIEDTDRERSKKEYEDSILDSFAWLGIEYDELHRQSENTEKYKSYLHTLVDSGHAYVSKEEQKEEGERDSVIRLKNPNKKVSFSDLILGEITVDTTDLKDFVIAKDFETPIFHFANVVDDHEMGITHIIRGQEHAPNTPRQILIHEALRFNTPEYAHIPLILSKEKKKMSKRDGDTNVYQYRENGYLPEAIINFLSLIGWNPGTDQEIFSLSDLITQFSLEKVQKSPGVFNNEKLDWTNKEYLKKLSYEEQEEYVAKFIPKDIKELPHFNSEMLHKITPIVMERISNGVEVEALALDGDLAYYFSFPKLHKDILIEKEKEPGTTKTFLEKVVEILTKMEENSWDKDSIKNALWDYATEAGRGQVLWPMRYALSGALKSPDPFILAEIFGQEGTLTRLNEAIQLLSK